MGRLTIDTSDVKQFKPAQPGPYLMTVDEFSDPYPSKEKKTPMIDVYLKFTDPNLDEECGRIRRSMPITGKGAGIFAAFWKAATGEDLPLGQEGGGSIDVDLDSALGRTVHVDVSNEKEENGDRVFNRADKILAAE